MEQGIGSVAGHGPWAARAIGRLERGDLVHIAVGQRDVIPAVQQARAADGINGEEEGSIAALDGLLLEIEGQWLARLLAEHGHERGRLVVGDDRGQQSVLDRIACEDVAEGWRNDTSDAVVVERIDRRLARGAAAVVALGDEDFGVAVGRLVEYEVALSPVLVEPQVAEQIIAETQLARLAQVAGRNDLIGVDIGTRHRHGDGVEFFESLHGSTPNSPANAARR